MHKYINGYHKLIRWKIVIHGGMYPCDQMTMFIRWHNDVVSFFAAIDGYSRLVTYLQCSDNNWADTIHMLLIEFSDNNQADTMHKLFIEVYWEYNIPSQVRCDLEEKTWTLHAG